MAVLGHSSQPYENICAGEAEEITKVSMHDLHVAHIAPLYSFKQVLSQTLFAVRLLDCLY